MKKGRILVVGDIHGSAKALTQVLERANFKYEEDTLIQLGDVADGWSETSECVDILLDIKARASENNQPIFIRGNHDIWVYDWLLMGIKSPLWLNQGGQATLDSYIRTGEFTSKEHQDFWLKDQIDWYIDEQNRLFIHAGWAYMDGRASWGIELSERELFERQASLKVNAGSIARECHWDRDVLYGAQSASVGTFGRFKALEQFKEIYIGHTATKDHLPHNYLNLWDLDSGCGWHGKLTIMDIETKEFWQSDKSKELYPNELGRK